MSNEHQSAEQLFKAAAAMPAEERSGFLDRACADDPTLRGLVEQMLEGSAIPTDFLRAPVLQGLTPDLPVSRRLDDPPRFENGDVIAGQFQVVRFIARGGMGEVYEVKDLFLHGTPVALKIIRPHIAADPYASRRFEQEVMLARSVNHRNLCPIYGIQRCEQPGPPFLFLTMKLLAGESLDSRLKRSGVVPLDEGVEICGQLIDGIEAIHKARIVHRDIKPSNVMLEPSGSGICVVIMDFGLARLSEAGATITRPDMVAGTPGYLAPELLRGGSPSAASDLYALGVVMHQVLTGHVPSLSRSGRAAMVSPELHLAKVPPVLVTAVTEFLSEDPERRCSAFEIVARTDSRVNRVRTPLLTRRGFAISGAAAFSCLGAGTLWKWPDIYDLLHPLPAKRFVALLNWPPPSDAKVTPILLGLIDSMVNALSRAEAFDHNFYVACQTSLTEMKTPAQVNDVCQSLGTNLILATSGSIVLDGIAISLQVLSADSAKVLRSRDIYVPSGQQTGLSERVTHAAAELLNVATLPVNRLVNQVGTENPEALAVFQSAEALMKEPNNGGLNEAIEKYKVAVELDPHFANAHARLAVAYMRIFEDHRDPASMTLARANAETALAIDPESVDAHAALAVLNQEMGDVMHALQEMAKALAPDPSNPRMIVYQAQIYFSLNRWQEAEEAYKRVLKARPNYWVAYNELGVNYSFQGKYRLALDAFQAASVTAPKNAQAVANSAQMLFFLGDLAQADFFVARSMALIPTSWALEIRSDIMRAGGKFFESAQAALQAAKMNPEDTTPWLRLGDAYVMMKRHDKESQAAYERAKIAMREVLQINPTDGSSWMLMALYQIKTGDAAGAISSMKKADDAKAVDIYSLIYKVRVLELLGKRNDALSALTTCTTMGATATQIRSTNDLVKLLSDPRCPSSVQLPIVS